MHGDQEDIHKAVEKALLKAAEEASARLRSIEQQLRGMPGDGESHSTQQANAEGPPTAGEILTGCAKINRRLWALERKCNETLKLMESYGGEAELDPADQKVLAAARAETKQERESIRKEYVDEMTLPWLSRAGVPRSFNVQVEIGPDRQMESLRKQRPHKGPVRRARCCVPVAGKPRSGNSSNGKKKSKRRTARCSASLRYCLHASGES